MEGCVATLTLLSSKWALPVLVALSDGPARRKHLKRRAAPINDDRLDAALSHHLRDGLITHAWIPGPRRDEPGYALTELGHSLLGALSSLAGWHEDHGHAVAEHRRLWDASHPSSLRP
jgi:DNA-binding HxlR family transcriptional regulator